MKNRLKFRQISLRNGLLTIIVLCWVMPILIIMSLAGVMLSNSYEQSAQQELEAGTLYGLRQVQTQLKEAINDSKDVSYDGTVKTAYRSFLEHEDTASLYRNVNAYLKQKFSRKTQYKAVFVSFWDQSIDLDVYFLGDTVDSYGEIRQCLNNHDRILDQLRDVDTEIRFLLLDGQMYLTRNLLDKHFNPYASLVIMLDPVDIFHAVSGIDKVKDYRVYLDDIQFCVFGDMLKIKQTPLSNPADVDHLVDLDGHTLRYMACLSNFSLWAENPTLGLLITLVCFMVLPLGIVVITLFQHHVTQPAEILARANQLVQSGRRGHQIEQDAPNMEFKKLYDHFNAMSADLQKQFETSYLEQQASQKAQIKALQSQINPHFLNNTLEIINWEARIAENDRVSAMIEALSTMLGAALDRNGRTQIPLEEEMGYVDAYLYIIRERMGENFHVYKKIDENTLPLLVPRLVLQPIVENAVEHDITARHGGEMWVRAYQRNRRIILEVEHDGSLTQEDREKIQDLLSKEPTKNRVGIQNVNQRLKLIYGDEGELTITETSQHTVMAKISFPVDAANQFTERSQE